MTAPAHDPEREALVQEVEESGYERECAAARLTAAMNAARDLQRIRDEDVAAWKRHRDAKEALDHYDARREARRD